MHRTSYYKNLKQLAKCKIIDAKILASVKEIRQIQPKLGTKKVKKLLELSSIEIGRDRLFTLLRDYNLLLKRKKNYAITTNSRHPFKKYPNLLKEASLTGPNQAYVADITYIEIVGSFMYLALIMDAWSRKIVGYHIGKSLEATGVLFALKMALANKPTACFPIHHSDRGIQYCCKASIKTLEKAGLKISMTEDNHCYENAQAERLNGILKQEYGLGECFANCVQAEKTTHQGIYLYNHKRPHNALNLEFPADKHESIA